MTSRILCSVLLAAIVLSPFVVPAAANAQADSDKRPRSRQASEAKKAAAKKAALKRNLARKPVTVEQIQRVDRFVEKNMPELTELLGVLKNAEPTRYEQAIRELFSATERLERLRPRDAKGYELALESWKLEKKMQLLVARIRMDDSINGAAELKKLLQKRFQVEMDILTRNRERLAARLSKMDEDIARRQKSHQAEIERLVASWTKVGPAKKGTTPVSERRSKKGTSRPTAKKNETKTKAKAKQ